VICDSGSVPDKTADCSLKALALSPLDAAVLFNPISRKVLSKWSGKSQFTLKSVNLFCKLVIVKVKLTDLWRS